MLEFLQRQKISRAILLLEELEAVSFDRWVRNATDNYAYNNRSKDNSWSTEIFGSKAYLRRNLHGEMFFSFGSEVGYARLVSIGARLEKLYERLESEYRDYWTKPSRECAEVIVKIKSYPPEGWNLVEASSLGQHHTTETYQAISTSGAAVQVQLKRWNGNPRSKETGDCAVTVDGVEVYNSQIDPSKTLFPVFVNILDLATGNSPEKEERERQRLEEVRRQEEANQKGREERSRQEVNRKARERL